MEQFYTDLADIVKKEWSMLYFEGFSEVDYIDEPDLLVYEDILCSEPCTDANNVTLLQLIHKGYKILMNFQGPNINIGNIVVKIKNAWFAFGECLNKDGNLYVSQIWPLKYVLPRLNLMRTELAFVFTVTETS